MKALLLKDFYMAKQYCKAYLLIAIVFCAASVANNGNMFFVFYPCILCGMIPVNLLAYDERSRWMQYSGTLPYTKAQIVSGKYLIGVITMALVLVMTAVAQMVRMAISGGFDLSALLIILSMVLAMATISASITLPFMFKWGVEKGRIAYYVMIGFVCAGAALASGLLGEGLQTQISGTGVFAMLALVGMVLYGFSWYLSIGLYQKREIK